MQISMMQLPKLSVDALLTRSSGGDVTPHGQAVVRRENRKNSIKKKN